MKILNMMNTEWLRLNLSKDDETNDKIQVVLIPNDNVNDMTLMSFLISNCIDSRIISLNSQFTVTLDKTD